METKLSSEDQNKINALCHRYDELISQYSNYLNANGYIQPKDFEEFFTWFTKFRHPNKPIEMLKIQENDLKRFHEYEVRRVKNKGWNDEREHEFLNGIKKSFFYHYSQKNSFGTFDKNVEDGIGTDVIIEAYSAQDANERAKKIGIYFDGVEKGVDCSCCGDRWYKCHDGEGAINPTINNKALDEIESGSYRKEAYIHYLDGRIERYKFKLSEKDRLKAEQLQADLEKSDYWRVYVYGIEGQDGWGKIAMNKKTGASIALGGKNFRCGMLFFNVDYFRLTEERNPTDEEMIRLRSFADEMKKSNNL